jgi:hypothetical protein
MYNFHASASAFTQFWNDCNSRIIAPGKNHSCAECSQPYKHTADFMANEDPAAVIGADENSAV